MTAELPKHRTLPRKAALPHALYRAEQVRALDRLLIEDFGIPGDELMWRAGTAAFELLRARWPDVRDILVVCGTGNNGGDGFVVAQLAREAGFGVRVLQLGDATRISGEALKMRTDFEAAGGCIEPFGALSSKTGLLVDAALGTGLEREVSGEWADALAAINAHPAPVLALDIPSGLNADTGAVRGVAVRADVTISFIGLKQGLFTGAGPECCGEVVFEALDAPARAYSSQILSARRLDWGQQAGQLPRRRRNAHKGDFGHVLVVGGAPGYSGAVRLAGEAAARTGAGLVSVATAPAHAPFLNLDRPELMCHGVADRKDLAPLLRRASVVAIGPGLSQGEWAAGLLAAVLETNLPLVVDADALNLLAADPLRRENWILTPHPGEAARLLRTSTAAIAADRFTAARTLQADFGGVAVLKGAGTLVEGPGSRPPAVCSGANPGMASGGMGDVLTGMIAALLAQGLELEQAATMGVSLHSAAVDMAAWVGERGLLASDLFAPLRTLLNPVAP